MLMPPRSALNQMICEREYESLGLNRMAPAVESSAWRGPMLRQEWHVGRPEKTFPTNSKLGAPHRLGGAPWTQPGRSVGQVQAPLEIVGMGSAQESGYGAVLGVQSQSESGVLLHASPTAKSSPYGAAHCTGALRQNGGARLMGFGHWGCRRLRTYNSTSSALSSPPPRIPLDCISLITSLSRFRQPSNHGPH